MTLPLLLAMGVWALALSLTLWGTWVTVRYVRKDGEFAPVPDTNLPPVSILKPLKGSEPGMEANLDSFFHLDYPEYEIIFSVADGRDPARALAEKLIAKYPRRTTRLIIGEVEIGPNPKVNNLVHSYEMASYDCLLISDSNVRVVPDYLSRVASCLTPDVGIVSAVVAGHAGEGLGGNLEAVFLNCFYSRWMQISRAIGHPFVVGKSMFFRRSVAERFGGIRNLARYIAEDYMAGQAMRRLGLKVRLTHAPIPQFIGKFSVEAFWARHLRWGRIRKAQAPVAFVFEPLLGSIISGALGAAAFSTYFGVSPSLFFVAHLFVWMICDGILLRTMGATCDLRSLGAWCLRELIAFPLWLHIASGNGVQWRGNRFRIHSGGLVSTL